MTIDPQEYYSCTVPNVCGSCARGEHLYNKGRIAKIVKTYLTTYGIHNLQAARLGSRIFNRNSDSRT